MVASDASRLPRSADTFTPLTATPTSNTRPAASINNPTDYASNSDASELPHSSTRSFIDTAAHFKTLSHYLHAFNSLQSTTRTTGTYYLSRKEPFTIELLRVLAKHLSHAMRTMDKEAPVKVYLLSKLPSISQHALNLSQFANEMEALLQTKATTLPIIDHTEIALGEKDALKLIGDHFDQAELDLKLGSFFPEGLLNEYVQLSKLWALEESQRSNASINDPLQANEIHTSGENDIILNTMYPATSPAIIKNMGLSGALRNTALSGDLTIAQVTKLLKASSGTSILLSGVTHAVWGLGLGFAAVSNYRISSARANLNKNLLNEYHQGLGATFEAKIQIDSLKEQLTASRQINNQIKKIRRHFDLDERAINNGIAVITASQNDQNLRTWESLGLSLSSLISLGTAIYTFISSRTQDEGLSNFNTNEVNALLAALNAVGMIAYATALLIGDFGRRLGPLYKLQESELYPFYARHQTTTEFRDLFKQINKDYIHTMRQSFAITCCFGLSTAYLGIQRYAKVGEEAFTAMNILAVLSLLLRLSYIEPGFYKRTYKPIETNWTDMRILNQRSLSKMLEGANQLNDQMQSHHSELKQRLSRKNKNRLLAAQILKVAIPLPIVTPQKVFERGVIELTTTSCDLTSFSRESCHQADIMLSCLKTKIDLLDSLMKARSQQDTLLLSVSNHIVQELDQSQHNANSQSNPPSIENGDSLSAYLFENRTKIEQLIQKLEVFQSRVTLDFSAEQDLESENDTLPFQTLDNAKLAIDQLKCDFILLIDNPLHALDKKEIESRLNQDHRDITTTNYGVSLRMRTTPYLRAIYEKKPRHAEALVCLELNEIDNLSELLLEPYEINGNTITIDHRWARTISALERNAQQFKYNIYHRVSEGIRQARE